MSNTTKSIHKFGGASICSLESTKKVAEIIKGFDESNPIIVVSAKGKTTNLLENITESFYRKDDKKWALLDELREDHLQWVEDLLGSRDNDCADEVNNLLVEVEWAIEGEPRGDYDFEYDQIVSIGELLSSTIISHYLRSTGYENQWVDIRDVIRTDNSYRRAIVDWEYTEKMCETHMNSSTPIVTQGFIGCTSENFTTTLGREGSDYTAAILAYCTNADRVCIWKDVPGLMNADPAEFEDAVKLDTVSFQEAIELAYYGAKVIHPKTIQPLKKKGIPLEVNSFIQPDQKGSCIENGDDYSPLVPSFIVKHNQVLLSIQASDYAFISEKTISAIFKELDRFGFRMNMMQNSAISFSVIVDNNELKLNDLIDALRKNYKVLFNMGLKLVTIRHYDEATAQRWTKNSEVLLEQRTRQTLQLLLKS
jgi:aspartate kinase